MINRQTATLLACYMAWADRLTFEAVRRLPEGEAAKPRTTEFTSILGTLNHTLVVDLIWRANLEGRPHGFTARNGLLHPDLDGLWAAQRAFDDDLLAWAEDQTDASLGEMAAFRFVSGEEGRATRGEILLHMVNHATYHRGWVADLFFQVPAKPPATDLSVFMVEAYRQERADGTAIELRRRRRQCA